MKRKIAILVALLCLGTVCFSAPAAAWEVLLSGTTSYSYLKYGYTGHDGFFGAFNQDANTGNLTGLLPTGLFAGTNGWFGTQIGDLVSGSDAATGSFSTSLFPVFRVNEAVQLQGGYKIGSSTILASPGVDSNFAVGEWTTWSVTIATPWGNVYYGKKPFSAGCGLELDGAGNRSEEMLSLTTDFGPMVFGLGFYPWTPAHPAYYNVSDGNNVGYNLNAWVSYSSVNFATGVGSRFVQLHEGPEGQRLQFFRDRYSARDREGNEGWAYFKFLNGRFFLNAEADWWYENIRYHPSKLGTSINDLPDGTPLLGGASFFAPRYSESWRYMIETGVHAGPAKISLLYAWLAGPDRRHGILIDRQPVEIDPDDNRGITYDPFSSALGGPYYYLQPAYWNPDRANGSVFRPYSMILNTAYAAGVGAVGYSGSGYMVDASILAARLDYSLAANFNVYGSFFYANRVSHGYGWGFIRPGQADPESVAVFGVVAGEYAITGGVTYQRTGSFIDPTPAIPDNNLGWEIDGGFDWSLLDGWKLSVAVGYWNVGKWFNFACIDRSVPGWNNPVPGNFWGIKPNRNIPGVYAVDIAMTLTF